MLFSKEERNEIILDHWGKPRNFEEIMDARYYYVDTQRDSCADHFVVGVYFKDGIVQDFKYSGCGCVISKTALSILSELVIGQTEEKVKIIMSEFTKMVKGEPYDNSLLGELLVFEDIKKQPGRIGCALLGVNGLERAIKMEEEKNL